jgi:hypothetical protein
MSGRRESRGVLRSRALRIPSLCQTLQTISSDLIWCFGGVRGGMFRDGTMLLDPQSAAAPLYPVLQWDLGPAIMAPNSPPISTAV